MKPTQQDIVDLAREAGFTISRSDKPYFVEMLQCFAALLLERFGAGAGGGEPVARVNDDGFIVETGLLISPGTALYTHPSPTDLRAEYLRGLEDAIQVCEQERIVKGGEVFAAKIEALKDKQ